MFSPEGGVSGSSPPGGGFGGGALPPVTVTLPEVTLRERYAVSLVNRTSYKVKGDVPEVVFAEKVISTRLPPSVTFPVPTIRLYMLMMRPAVLSISPALKNV
jgi:hypothetical protein